MSRTQQSDNFTPRTRTDPDQLRLIVDLRARGWDDREIARQLGISERTMFRRNREIRERNGSLKREDRP
jgi:DNA-binding NarL/FixJ family response regulator